MKKSLKIGLSLLLCATFLVGCGQSYDAKESTVYITKKGKVVSTDVENFSSDYEKGDLESYVDAAISAYNQENGAEAVIKKSLTVEEEIAKLTIEYLNSDVFTAFNGVKLFAGTVAEAKSKGYDFAVDFAKIEKGAFVSEVDASEITGQEELKVVVIQGNFNVQVPGNILYVSTKNVALIDKNTIAIAEGNAMDESLKEDTQATESADVVQEFATETEELLEDEPSDATEDVDQMVFDFPAEEEAPKSEFTSVCTYIVYK